MCKFLHEKYPLFLSDFTETWNLWAYIWKQSWNLKFNQNPFIGSRIVAYGRIDMTKLIVAFRNFANAPTYLLYSMSQFITQT